jgi:hypothetical protein
MPEDFQIAYVCSTFDGLVKRVDELEKRNAELESRLKTNVELDARRSSIEVGTPAKGGAIKGYIDPFGDKVKNEEAIVELLRLLILAGGSPTKMTGV